MSLSKIVFGLILTFSLFSSADSSSQWPPAVAPASLPASQWLMENGLANQVVKIPNGKRIVNGRVTDEVTSGQISITVDQSTVIVGSSEGKKFLMRDLTYSRGNFIDLIENSGAKYGETRASLTITRDLNGSYLMQFIDNEGNGFAGLTSELND